MTSRETSYREATVTSTTLEQAVARWIRASYMFWHGPYAHGNDATEELVLAEQELRRTLTGSPTIEGAAAHELCEIDFEQLERLYRARKEKGDAVGFPGCSDPYPTPPVNPRYARLPEDGTPTTRTKKKKSKKKITRKKVRIVRR